MDKKIIYLSPSIQEYNVGNSDYGTEEKMMNKIADELEIILENTGRYIVYRNNPNMKINDIIVQSNRIKPDIHVALHSNAGGGVGPEVFAYKPGISADILAKDIYSSLLRVYYNKNYGRGVKYSTKIKELSKTKAPAVEIEIGFHDNANDVNWIKNNTYVIAQAIADGINTYFKK